MAPLTSQNIFCLNWQEQFVKLLNKGREAGGRGECRGAGEAAPGFCSVLEWSDGAGTGAVRSVKISGA